MIEILDEQIAKSEKYICPVCGYPDMCHPAADWNICPCCLVEFELEDEGRSHEELRAEWIADGMQWISHYDNKPDNWDPIAQVEAIKGKHIPSWKDD